MFKSFKLAGKTYKVKTAGHDSDNLGLAKTPLCEIWVQTVWAGKPVPEVSQEQTACHEVVHCILDEIGRADLNADESFVQSFAALMHQFIKTKK